MNRTESVIVDVVDVLDETIPSGGEESAICFEDGSRGEDRGHVSLLLYSRHGVRIVSLNEEQTVVVGRLPPADVIIRDQSLSRRHAHFELRQGVVWVDDLDSTNGTWVDGARVTQPTPLNKDSEVSFGAVTAAVQDLGPADRGRFAWGGHDDFQRELTSEVSRARAYGRSVALLMVRPDPPREPRRLSRWFSRLQAPLRSFDRVAMYSVDTVQIALPELSSNQADEVARAIVSEEPALRCGLGVFPFHAASADELFEVARVALQRASASRPICSAGERATTAGQAVAVPASQGPLWCSPATEKLVRIASRVASSPIPVLICGETGTGKELLARTIHEQGKRASLPMICVNCGAIPPQLVESTLFGHERGAFTGAGQQAKGVFESAHGGTVLLDEIGELPLLAQTALLRVLEGKRFTRVGSTTEVEVDVRIVAATHRSLEKMCESGEFRSDLLYRLNAMKLNIPPLRQRPEEIEPFCFHFVRYANEVNHCGVTRIAPDVLELFQRYPWPGNVRELRNAIERAVVIAHEEMITVDDLPECVRDCRPQPLIKDQNAAFWSSTDHDAAAQGQETFEALDLRAELHRYEATIIGRALTHTYWDRNEAARLLKLPVRTLARKIQQLRLSR
jgi:DNA-binding NtrC family response regulator